jgi:hypothetical protein
MKLSKTKVGICLSLSQHSAKSINPDEVARRFHTLKGHFEVVASMSLG